MHIHLRSAALLLCLFTLGCGGGGGGGGLDGTIYYSAISDGFIYQLSLASGENKKLIFGGYPNRTPQGTFIYVNGSNLSESADGVMVRTIIPFNADIPKFDNGFQHPQLSPDGTLIAYNTNDNLVYVCRRDNGQIVSHFTESPPGLGLNGWYRPSWTQDNRLVVSGQLGTPGLFISDAGWSTFTRFDPMLNAPSWAKVSPQGDRVAFIVNSHIFVMKLDGTGLKQVTMGNFEEVLPSWSADGSAIAAWQTAHLITVSTDGTNLHSTDDAFPSTLFDFNSSEQFDWLR